MITRQTKVLEADVGRLPVTASESDETPYTIIVDDNGALPADRLSVSRAFPDRRKRLITQK
ncbi:MAG: hypothetical protein IJ242_03360 [Clostridia bacterium]|nr:hypothetical protein [Clostridia bacterium]